MELRGGIETIGTESETNRKKSCDGIKTKEQNGSEKEKENQRGTKRK